MLNNAPIINLLAPFFAAFAICGFGFWKRQIAQPIAIIGLSVSLISSLATLMLVSVYGSVSYSMGGWSPPFGIAFKIDMLNALIAVLIQFVALMSVINAGWMLRVDIGPNRHFYYALFLLFVTGVTGITQTADAFNLYVLIEVASLTSYALIGMGEKRSAHAALNYLFMGSIGATFYLLGVGYLYIKTGTLNMYDIHHVLLEQDLFGSASIQVAAILIILGLWLKMALFPFHGWLPNAYTYSPLSSAALMAPLMTKVMIYVMIRFMLSIFGFEHILELAWSKFVPALAIIAIFYGSSMALMQRDLRRLITYIIVAEVGYMVGAAWLGNDKGLVAAFFHIISDSVMTLCMMLAIASLIFKHQIKTIDDFTGAFSKMPVTMGVFTLGALALIGIPPTSGFFSKWYLLGGGIDAGNWIYVIALLFSSFVNAVIFFRIFEIACFGKNPAEVSSGHHADHNSETLKSARSEAPFIMVFPSVLTAFTVLFLGLWNQPIVQFIQSAVSSLNNGGLN